ncbi:Lrp/AsnC family transcriptional regulator [Homoserinibacter sp. GY 40078]|uniref:Lrp/AsnC family transcriptional regulator n=1 Tax=Homoserinibacter sp. GY 40078 TaxID=2603275 RepID=UPI0011C9EF5F|nr:Lrp/AsnC family transcriptional regulator [Homoserinibacter sp. GY 40078]TXK16975.1 Lrp/AsnC family transcriptional regulator [Homoserinibacter sp. GY 40078]
MTQTPPPASTMAGLSTLVARSRPAVPLDETDRELLSALAADPRISQRQLAKQIGMSAPSIGERVARLERLGVIRGYTVDIDWSAVDLPVLVYMPITIAIGADVKMLVEQLRAIAELEELVVVTGGYDLIARFRLRDHAHLQELLLDRLYPIPGLQRFETFLSLGEIPAAIALDEILARRAAE